jgi:FkbM family methyltransferase
MPGSIQQRLACIIKRKLIPPGVRPGLWETLWRSSEWYGLHRRRVRGGLKILDFGKKQLVEWHGMKVVLPRSFPLDRLVSIIVELEVPSNPHYFFHPKITPTAGDWVLDVGACEGLFSLLSQRRWPHSPVFAVEPGLEMCEALQDTFSLNGVGTQMRVENCLLGATNGEAGFIEDTADPARSRVVSSAQYVGVTTQRVVRVNIRMIDELFRDRTQRVGVIKMDAEGAELEILKGAGEVLRRDRPALCLTTYHNLHDATEISSWLTELGLGYKIEVRGITCMDTTSPRPIMLFALPPADFALAPT